MSKKIVDYVILCENDMFQITEQIIKFLQEGFQPYGNPMMGIGAFAQAMVKYQED